MKPENIKAARGVARELIRRINEAEAIEFKPKTAESAAVARASMELSRVLSRMRREK